MLKIRLARVGRKNQPYFRLIVSEDSFDSFGKYLEILGSFNPRRKKETLKLKEERIKHWLEQGAKPSASVHNLLVDNDILKEPKLKATKKKQKKKEDDKKTTTDGKPQAKKQEKPKETNPAQAENEKSPIETKPKKKL